MMEPHASLAAWSGDKLTLWTSNQMIDWSTTDLAKTLGIAKENVRLISPFIGGGFGAKLWLRADALLAALGARAAGRPVKVALPRAFVADTQYIGQRPSSASASEQPRTERSPQSRMRAGPAISPVAAPR